MDKKIKWEVIEEMNDDDGSPTCWSAEINHWYYGKYCWITYYGEKYGYVVEVEGLNGCYTELVRCKSFTSAKRWVTIHFL